MAAPATTRLTIEEFLAFVQRPENADRLWELDRGEVIEMSRPGELHGFTCATICMWLTLYLLRRGSGYFLPNDTGYLVERKPDTLRGPDVMLYLEDRNAEQMASTHTERRPDLIIEVLSPFDRTSDVNRKVSQYLTRGVPLVWLVDPDLHCVTVYRPGEMHRVLDGQDDLSCEEVLPGLRLTVADLFQKPTLTGIQ
jgi:Uma2 family endonuclease